MKRETSQLLRVVPFGLQRTADARDAEHSDRVTRDLRAMLAVAARGITPESFAQVVVGLPAAANDNVPPNHPLPPTPAAKSGSEAGSADPISAQAFGRMAA